MILTSPSAASNALSSSAILLCTAIGQFAWNGLGEENVDQRPDNAPESEELNGAVQPSSKVLNDIRRLQSEIAREPAAAALWRTLGRALREQRRRVPAAAAFARSITASLPDPEFKVVEDYLRAGKLAEANRLLAARLEIDADDLVALKLAGDMAARTGRAVDAERLYRRCIDLCPSYVPARYGLSRLLLRQARLGEASNESERMLATAPTDPSVRTLKAAIASSGGHPPPPPRGYEGGTPARPGTQQEATHPDDPTRP